MARVICGISGIEYKCDHIPMLLHKRETAHPIFFLSQKKLLELYQLYSEDQLTETDSYLLFLALLHSTESVNFVVPAVQDTNTQKIIAANIAQVVHIILTGNAIQHPAFKFPGFYVRSDTANLHNVHIWIQACLKNIEDFRTGMARAQERDALREVETKLASLIKSPETGDIKLAAAIANWANRAAEFPKHKAEYWMSVIRKCYNLKAMFSTPKQDLIDIRNFCEDNLEVGSIYFHTLMEILRTGISNHNNFLGLDSVNLFSSSLSQKYTLLDDAEGEEGEGANTGSKEKDILLDIIASAPKEFPIRENYPSQLAFIRAKLAYQQAKKYEAQLAQHQNKEIQQ